MIVLTGRSFINLLQIRGPGLNTKSLSCSILKMKKSKMDLFSVFVIRLPANRMNGEPVWVWFELSFNIQNGWTIDMLDTLLDDFIGEENVDFNTFKKIWKKLRFGEVLFLHQLDRAFATYNENQRSLLEHTRLETAYQVLLRKSSCFWQNQYSFQNHRLWLTSIRHGCHPW